MPQWYPDSHFLWAPLEFAAIAGVLMKTLA